MYFFSNEWEKSIKLNLFTDAAGAIGFGAISGNDWYYGKWPPHWLHRNIAVLELFPIVLSLCLLMGKNVHNQSILFFTDNEALVHVINKQSCRDKTLMTLFVTDP